jgi:hypothetical protein
MAATSLTFNQYRSWFENERQALELEPAALSFPQLTTSGRFEPPPPWKLEWCIIYPDGSYIRIREDFSQTNQYPKNKDGVRNYMSFHYGIRPNANRVGRKYKSSDPTFLRLCSQRKVRDPHLHYGSEHHEQISVKGLDIANCDLFTFIRAIQRNRQTGESLHEIYQFEIT